MVNRLPTESCYEFLDSCNISDWNNFENLSKIIRDRAQWLIEDIDNILRCEKNDGSRIRKFYIGNTYAPLKSCKHRNEIFWTFEGMKEVWEHNGKRLEKEGYNFLLGFAVLTAGNLPKAMQPAYGSFLRELPREIESYFKENKAFDSKTSCAYNEDEQLNNYLVQTAEVIYLAVSIIENHPTAIGRKSFFS